jgi:opacity protein-like surface antigen
MSRASIFVRAFAAGAFLLGAAATADAQVVRVDSGRNSIGFNLGYFALKGLDSRVPGDVLLEDLSQGEFSLLFDVDDFNGATFGGEWLLGIGDYLEAGFGAGFYQRNVDSIYEQKVRDDGAELEQDLKLRVIPLTATIRFLPLGRGGVEPYVGAGIGAFNWRYSEVGEFIFEDGFTYQDRFIADGTAVGPVVLGGIRFPVADMWTVGGELRYQKAEGKGLLEENELFLGDKIDLGGWSTSFTVHLRF